MNRQRALLGLTAQPWLLLERSYRNWLLLSSGSVFLSEDRQRQKCATGRNDSKVQSLLLVLSRDCPQCPQDAGITALKEEVLQSMSNEVWVLQKSFAKTLRGEWIPLVRGYSVTTLEQQFSRRAQNPSVNVVVKQEGKIRSLHCRMT